VLWYPTQAKVRLEWGTQLFLPVKDDNHAAPDVLSKFRASLNFMAGSQGPQEIQGDMILMQRRLGAPFKPYFGLSGIPQHSLRLFNPDYSPLEPESLAG
jgi:hypothetical protein